MAEPEFDMRRQRDEIQEYLAKIRKTVAESEAMAQQVELRIQETDRLLASQGLTREQVLGFQFTDEQRELVNRELERRGLGRLDFSTHEGFDDLTDSVRAKEDDAPAPAPRQQPNEVEERADRFRMMMREFRVS